MSEQVEAPKAKPGRAKPGRKKGTPKTGGRVKGTPNRNSLSVLGALDRAGIPVIEFLVADIQALEPKERIPEWKALLSFCYPKLKDVEHAETFAAPPAPDAPSPIRNLTNDELIRLVRTPEQKANA